MGRRKITIAPITDDRNRSVTFLKRKGGLFKKAYELGVLCGADVAVIVFAGNGKLYEFSSGDLNSTLMRYSNHDGPPHEHRGPGDFDGTKIKGKGSAAASGVGARAQANGTGAEDDDDDDDAGDDVGDDAGDDAGEVSEGTTSKSKIRFDSGVGSLGHPMPPWTFLGPSMAGSSGSTIPGFPSPVPPGAYPSPFDPSSFPPHPGHPGYPSFPPAYYAPYPPMHTRHPSHPAGGPTAVPTGSPGFPNIFGPGVGGYPGMPPPLPHGQGSLAGLGGPPPGYANLAAAAAAAEVYWGFSAQPPQGSPPHPQTAAVQVAQPRYDFAALAAAAAASSSAATTTSPSAAPSFGTAAGSAGDLSAYRLSGGAGGSNRPTNAPASISPTVPSSSSSNLADVSISKSLRRTQAKERNAKERRSASVATTRRAADQDHEEDQGRTGPEGEGEARGRPRPRMSPPDPGSAAAATAEASGVALPATAEGAAGGRKEEDVLIPSPGSFLPSFDDPADGSTFEWPGTSSRS